MLQLNLVGIVALSPCPSSRVAIVLHVNVRYVCTLDFNVEVCPSLDTRQLRHYYYFQETKNECRSLSRRRHYDSHHCKKRLHVHCKVVWVQFCFIRPLWLGYAVCLMSSQFTADAGASQKLECGEQNGGHVLLQGNVQ